MTAVVLHMQNLQSWANEMSSPRSHKQVQTTRDPPAALAPRYQAWADNPLDRAELPRSKAIRVTRARLSPRSRLGCWTCRTRKVKCDETRPECTPCSRLGHTCDYNPRLSFKDDTPRIIEKVTGGGDAPGPAWNLGPTKRQRLNPLQDDLLPSFATLTNDEDRERKAEFRRPGTYLVVVNTASFADYEEYRGKGDSDSHLNTPISRHSNNPRTPVGQFLSDPFPFMDVFTSNIRTTNDPDVVLLKVFEDDSQKITPPPGGLSAMLGRTSRASTFSDCSTMSVPSSITPVYERMSPVRYAFETSPLLRMAHPDGRDHQLIYYYKSFVHRHLQQVHRDHLGTPAETGSVSSADVFECQASSFLPLYHALMAFSALSMSQKAGSTQNLSATALQHYQQTLPSLQASLRTEGDLASDGVFLTHFVLLLYEFAAAEPYGMSLWRQHISQLLRIILMRREIYRRERYSFIVWWVATIDTHVLLSGMGDGTFVETMLQHSLLPSGLEPDEYHQPTSIPAAAPNIPHSLSHSLPSALAFHRRVCTLAAQLGLLARDLREEERLSPAQHCSSATIAARQRRVSDFQDLLRHTWTAQIPVSIAGGYENLVLPVGVRGLFEHSFALHRSLVIYSYTSLPRSSISASPSHPDELSGATHDILNLAREIVSHSHFERKFIVFPLFMAGFASSSLEEKTEVLSLVRSLEADSVGRNVIAARELLECVYAQQAAVRRGRVERRRRDGGMGSRLRLWANSWDGNDVHDVGVDGEVGEGVDWIKLMHETGLQAVNCRL